MSVSQTDNEVIQVLIRKGALSISDLEKDLGVTATAVRQRLTRLMENGFVDRIKQDSDGRGRPVHKYRLTDAGRGTSGHNLADLARALWQEIQACCDESTKKKILSGTVQRLAHQYGQTVNGESVEERLNAAAKVFSDRDIPIVVDRQDGLPVLKILACPYPEIGEHDHEICEMEKQLFSEVVGGSVELCECRKDGDSCCTFVTNSVPKNLETGNHA